MNVSPQTPCVEILWLYHWATSRVGLDAAVHLGCISSDILTPLGLGGQTIQVTAGPFFTPNTSFCWIWPLSSTSQRLCHIHFTVMLRTLGVALVHPNFCFWQLQGSSWMNTFCQLPWALPNFPHSCPWAGVLPFPGSYPERETSNQWFSIKTGPIPQGVFWKFVDMLIACHNDGSYINYEFHLISK